MRRKVLKLTSGGWWRRLVERVLLEEDGGQDALEVGLRSQDEDRVEFGWKVFL